MSEVIRVFGTLWLVSMLILSACGAADVENTPTPLETLMNMEFKNEFTQSGTALLTNGEYREPAAPDSASETVVVFTQPVAHGVLDGQQAAAVVLATNSGGSGTFFDVHVVMEENGGPVDVASASLGDRVNVESLAIENNQIVIEMVTHGPDDPLCCPTQLVRQTYELQENQLVQTSSELIGELES